MNIDLRLKVLGDEKIMYELRPNKKPFILEVAISPLFVFFIAALFFTFITYFICQVNSFSVLDMASFISYVVCLSIIFLYIGKIILQIIKYNNEFYIITNKAVYISNCFNKNKYIRLEYTENTFLEINKEFYDYVFKTGCIKLFLDISNDTSNFVILKNLSNYEEVVDKIKSLKDEMVYYNNKIVADDIEWEYDY